MSHYRFIREEKAMFPVATLCRVLKVGRSGYYTWARRGASARAIADAALAEQIASAHGRSRRTYGAPRVHAVLRAQGVRCARKRVARLMRAAGLVGCHRRRRARTTVADPAHTPAPNLVARDFTAPTPDRCGLETLHTSRPRKGGSTSRSSSTPARAAWWAGPWLSTSAPSWPSTPSRWRFSATDRGCQYAAAAYREALAARGITASMSRSGDCYDNAMAESFFATLKAELVDSKAWPTRAAARQAIFEWLEVWYNRQRRHSTLAYHSPVSYEDTMLLLSHQVA